MDLEKEFSAKWEMPPSTSDLYRCRGNSHADSRPWELQVLTARQDVSCGFLRTLRNFSAHAVFFQRASFLPRMAFNTLEHRNIAEIYRVFERFICPMAGFALAIRQVT